MDRAAAYRKLYSAYEQAYNSKTKQQIQADVNKLWNEAKSNPDSFEKTIQIAIDSATQKIAKNKAKLASFWSRSLNKQGSVVQSSRTLELQADQQVSNEPSVPSTSKAQCGKPSAKRPAPVQERIQNQLADVNDELTLLYGRKERGLLAGESASRMQQLQVDKKSLESELRKKQGDQIRSQKRRDDIKKSYNELSEKLPEAMDILKMRESVGRPRAEEDQPELLKAIVEIAKHGSAAHGRRQDDSFRSVRTLSELTDELNRQGYDISRSATYLRLIPRRANSSEGRRHVKTVPVKLAKAQNDKHSQHEDGKFCTATIRMLEELSSLLGPREVFFLSQDDKARVPLGLTAATKQSPMVMHVEYKISLADHDFVVAKQHKLIPSVYAAIKIHPDGMGKPEAVAYSGPTYVAIRSAKHSSSTALSHGLDYNRLLELAEMEDFARQDNVIKPIHVVISDGGPDENPRYQKVIKVAIHHFVSHDLDALFLATNAPGRRAYNRVERRMAPLTFLVH